MLNQFLVSGRNNQDQQGWYREMDQAVFKNSFQLFLGIAMIGTVFGSVFF